jgi:hypothetical protein
MPGSEVVRTLAHRAAGDVRVWRVQGAGKHRLSLLDHIYVEAGTKADWDALCELHYKGHSLAAGSHFYRAVLREPGEPDRLIGVMVFANPQPLSSGATRSSRGCGRTWTAATTA